jgi:hypothetical protein
MEELVNRIHRVLTKNKKVIIVIILISLLGAGLGIINAVKNINNDDQDPQVDIKCVQGEEEIKIVLSNPSNSNPAEQFNVLLNIDYVGGGSSYPDDAICKMDNYKLENDYTVPYTTLISCKYIPPKSDIHLDIITRKDSYYWENKQIGYSYWGKTTPKRGNLILECF